MTSPASTMTSPARAFLARLADVGAHGGRRGERHDGAWAPVAFHHVDDLVLHHGVGVVGQLGTRHDAHALACGDGARVHAARADLRDDGQLHRILLSRALDIRRMEGEAVHGRVSERRDVDVAAQILRRDAPDRVENRHALGRQRRHVGQHELARLLERNHLFHSIPFRKKRLPPLRRTIAEDAGMTRRPL